MEEMPDESTEAQVENTVVMTTRDLLNGNIGDISFDDPAVINLITFINSIVLFGKVNLPAREDNEPLENIPDILKPIFKKDLIHDAKERLSEARDETLNMARHVLRSEAENMSEANILKTFINHTLSYRDEWSDAFWADIKRLLVSEADYDVKGRKKALREFTDAKYDALDNEIKLAIYYLWRCYYNASLSFDKQRTYLNNIARTPFVKLSYRAFSNKTARKFNRSNDNALIHHSNLFNMPLDYQDTPLPILLSDVLKKAKYERSNIAEAILDLRDTAGAKSFRKHYWEIQQEKDFGRMLINMKRDFEELSNQWNKISNLDLTSLTFSVPMLAAMISAILIEAKNDNPEITIERMAELNLYALIPLLIKNIPLYNDLLSGMWRCKHMWVYWKTVPSKDFSSTFKDDIEKTFRHKKIDYSYLQV